MMQNHNQNDNILREPVGATATPAEPVGATATPAEPVGATATPDFKLSYSAELNIKPINNANTLNISTEINLNAEKPAVSEKQIDPNNFKNYIIDELNKIDKIQSSPYNNTQNKHQADIEIIYDALEQLFNKIDRQNAALQQGIIDAARSPTQSPPPNQYITAKNITTHEPSSNWQNTQMNQNSFSNDKVHRGSTVELSSSNRNEQQPSRETGQKLLDNLAFNLQTMNHFNGNIKTAIQSLSNKPEDQLSKRTLSENLNHLNKVNQTTHTLIDKLGELSKTNNLSPTEQKNLKDLTRNLKESYLDIKKNDADIQKLSKSNQELSKEANISTSIVKNIEKIIEKTLNLIRNVFNRNNTFFVSTAPTTSRTP